jgi:hypothetical protein
MARKDCDLSLVHRRCRDLFLRSNPAAWLVGRLYHKPTVPRPVSSLLVRFLGLAFTVAPSKVRATSLLGTSQMGFYPPSSTDLHGLGAYLEFAPPGTGLHSFV